jgi:hypothetical protein
VHEHILATVIANDETEALLAVEKLYDASTFADHLRRHAATAAETTAAEAATTAAAEAAATAAAEAATAAESVTTATETATEAAVEAATAVEIVVAETVALVSATSAAIPAAPSIKTHALSVFPLRPIFTNQTQAPDEKRRFTGLNDGGRKNRHSPKLDRARTKFVLIAAASPIFATTCALWCSAATKHPWIRS